MEILVVLSALSDLPGPSLKSILRTSTLMCALGLGFYYLELTSRRVMSKRILSSEDVTNAEALRLLEEALQKFESSSPEVDEALAYLRKFVKLDADKARELVNELVSRFGIARMTAIQIVNIMPRHVEELKVILGLEKREFSEKELQEMLELINKYRKEKK